MTDLSATTRASRGSSDSLGLPEHPLCQRDESRRRAGEKTRIALCGSDLGAADVLVATEKQDCSDGPDPIGEHALCAVGRLLLDV